MNQSLIQTFGFQKTLMIEITQDGCDNDSDDHHGSFPVVEDVREVLEGLQALRPHQFNFLFHGFFHKKYGARGRYKNKNGWGKGND